jgi:uncharacterized protein with PQ loop repeat
MAEFSNAFLMFMIIIPFITNAFIFLQGYKVWVRNSHDDISLIAVVSTVISTIAWGYYGVKLQSLPLIISSITALIGLVWLLWLITTIPSKDKKWKYL